MRPSTKYILSASVSVAAFIISTSTPAFAQSEEAADANAEPQMEDIVVTTTPIRDSAAAAIIAKRESYNVVDIISSDSIGRFPDQNLSDSLARLPGLAVERDQGQARYINFRGAPFRYTAIALEGVEIPGAENGRIPRFDSFPSAITSTVEAHKAITPDMPGGAVSGYINIGMFDPFSREGFSFSGEGGYGQQSLGDGDIIRYNLRTSWSNDKLGIVLFGSHNQREQITDNREFDLDLEAGTNELIVNDIDYRHYTVDREENALGGKIEFRPDNGKIDRIFVSSLYSEFVDKEKRNQYVFDFARGSQVSMVPNTPGDTGYAPAVVVSRFLEDGRYDVSTFTSTLGVDFSVSDWLVETRVNWTETRYIAELPAPFSTFGVVAADYDLTNLLDPHLQLYAPFSTNPTTVTDVNFAQNFVFPISRKLLNDGILAKFDASRDMSFFGRESTLKLGAQYVSREADGNGLVFLPGALPPGINIEDYETNNALITTFDNSVGGVYHDNAGLIDDINTATGGIDFIVPPDQEILIEEDIISAYVMQTLQYNWGNFTAGMRVEHTDYTSAGPSINAAYSDTYTNFLPSAHLNVDLAENVKFRVSASTGVSRPTFEELRASASVDPIGETVIGGNPTLNAEKAWGGDVSLEWYFAPASLFSIGAFHRFIDDVIYADTTTINGGIYLDSAEGQDWTLVGYANGRDGQLSGIEVNFVGTALDLLPSPFDGFGLSGSATLLHSEFKTLGGDKFSLPGTSDYLYNVSIFYEKYGVSTRLNYQYRDDWLNTTENNDLAEYVKGQERLDASIRYTMPSADDNVSVTIFADANNLTNEKDTNYKGSMATPTKIEVTGRSFVIGVRVDY